MPIKLAVTTNENKQARRSGSDPDRVPTNQPESRLNMLLRQSGNRAIQRALNMPRPSEPFELDEQSEKRIDQERGKGMPLDDQLQAELSQSMGYDLSQVRVHTSSEADALNQQLNAKAFTSGTDIYFRGNSFDPGSSSGRELLTHELTHVIQQGTGQVQSAGDGMTVTAPDDSFEKEADKSAEAQASASQTVQPQEEEEDEPVQMQGEEDTSEGEGLPAAELSHVPPDAIKKYWDNTYERGEQLSLEGYTDFMASHGHLEYLPQYMPDEI